MRAFTVDQKIGLLAYLFRVLSDTKKTRVREFLKNQAVHVNDKAQTQFDYPLKPGDKVTIETDKKSWMLATPPLGVKVVFEDQDLIVVEKPAGLLSIATEKVRTKTAFYAVNEYLNQKERLTRIKKTGGRFNRPVHHKQIFLVHRLDQDTSGLIVFAKNQEGKENLQEDFKQRYVRKRYYALVEGKPNKPSGTIESFLRENKFLRMASVPEEGIDGKHAVTHYKLLKSNEQFSLLDIDLETGRKHQIRVHMADIGHPVVGDEIYGTKGGPLGRMGLHAYYLSFQHPETRKRMEFKIPAPPVFEQIFRK